MKRYLLILLAAVLVFGTCGCIDKTKSAEASSHPQSASTGDEATADEATRDSATGDSADDDGSLHPLNKKLNPDYFAVPLKHRHASLETEELYQNPELPTGCESVALTSALRMLGFELEKTEFVDNYLTYEEEDVMWGYVGDPYEYDGAGIYPPGLTECTNAFLLDHGAKYTAYNTMGVAFEDLLKLVDDGYPVLLWTTMNYESPIMDDYSYEYEGEEYYWFELEHCVLLCGYDLDEGTVTVNDSLRGIETVDLEQMSLVYDEIGKMSMAILDK